jgi:hypothetical protein
MGVRRLSELRGFKASRTPLRVNTGRAILPPAPASIRFRPPEARPPIDSLRPALRPPADGPPDEPKYPAPQGRCVIGQARPMTAMDRVFARWHAATTDLTTPDGLAVLSDPEMTSDHPKITSTPYRLTASDLARIASAVGADPGYVSDQGRRHRLLRG